MKFKRGQVWLLKDDGHGKQRPAIIVSNDTINRSNAVMVVPLTSQQIATRDQYDWCVKFYHGEFGLTADSIAKADAIAIRPVSTLDRKIGELSLEQMRDLETAMKSALGMT